MSVSQHLSTQPKAYSNEYPIVYATDESPKSAAYNIVFVIGPPGSGKGTQCQMIEETYGYAHISVGDMLRAERACKDSEFGGRIAQCMNEGSIVPVEITCELIKRELSATKSPIGCFLIDGFPLDKENLDGWKKQMKSKVFVPFVLVLQAPLDLCVTRCLSRGRVGDNQESMKARIATYNQQTVPVIQHFKDLGVAREIVSSKSPNEVFQQIRNVFLEYGIKPIKI